jgi:hypothetical protein
LGQDQGPRTATTAAEKGEKDLKDWRLVEHASPRIGTTAAEKGEKDWRLVQDKGPRIGTTAAEKGKKCLVDDAGIK